MIAPNTRKQIRKRLATSHFAEVHRRNMAVQQTFNAIFWQSIRKHAMDAAEEPDENADGILTLSREELKAVPANFGLVLKGDEDSISVVATIVKPKSDILLPGN